jgi:hypothetical protein
MRTIMQAILLVILVGLSNPTHSQTGNFKDRQAIIINNAPQQIELSEFKFENRTVSPDCGCLQTCIGKILQTSLSPHLKS